MNENTLEDTKRELKVRALLERIAMLENDKVDLRVELTLMQAELESYKSVPVQDAPTAE